MTDIEFVKLKITQDDVGNTSLTLNGVELTNVKGYNITQDTHNFPQVIIELLSKTPEIEHLINKNNIIFTMVDKSNELNIDDIIDNLIFSVEKNNSVEADPLTLRHKLNLYFNDKSVYRND